MDTIELNDCQSERSGACRGLSTLVVSMSLLAGSPTHAAVYALDDSATIVHGGIVAMQWRSATPGPRATPSVDGRTLVSLALNTQRWAGKRGRIYMALAPQPVRCEVRWTTRGMTLPGRIEPGQRVLVFEGIVPGPTLNDTLEVSVSADGRELQLAQRLRFSYEIEVLP